MKRSERDREREKWTDIYLGKCVIELKWNGCLSDACNDGISIFISYALLVFANKTTFAEHKT